MRLGRVDSTDGGSAGRIPSDDAPVAEIVAFMKQLGAKPGDCVLLCIWGVWGLCNGIGMVVGWNSLGKTVFVDPI